MGGGAGVTHAGELRHGPVPVTKSIRAAVGRQTPGNPKPLCEKKSKTSGQLKGVCMRQRDRDTLRERKREITREPFNFCSEVLDGWTAVNTQTVNNAIRPRNIIQAGLIDIQLLRPFAPLSCTNSPLAWTLAGARMAEILFDAGPV